MRFYGEACKSDTWNYFSFQKLHFIKQTAGLIIDTFILIRGTALLFLNIVQNLNQNVRLVIL